jgi:hypothetical protein
MSENYYNLPTHKQLEAAHYLLQQISDFYQPIHIYRYDTKFKTLYIQAGVNDEIAILIDEEGNSNFV